MSKPKKLTNAQVAELLNATYEKFNQPEFIESDPVSVPHRFSKKQDIEIAAFFAAILAWGQRKTIINKTNELMKLMDNAPYDFVVNHQDTDLKPFLSFKHRTFNATDTLYFIDFFKRHYTNHDTLETAFSQFVKPGATTTEEALTGFHSYFFDDPDAPARTRKHIATPLRGSTCKRLSMFLRWMIRQDDRGVDFGIWTNLRPHQLVCPCDVHVERVARSLGLITRPRVDWQTALELTSNLKKFDKNDPVKYDFALFGLGIERYF